MQENHPIWCPCMPLHVYSTSLVPYRSNLYGTAHLSHFLSIKSPHPSETCLHFWILWWLQRAVRLGLGFYSYPFCSGRSLLIVMWAYCSINAELSKMQILYTPVWRLSQSLPHLPSTVPISLLPCAPHSPAIIAFADSRYILLSIF